VKIEDDILLMATGDKATYVRVCRQARCLWHSATCSAHRRVGKAFCSTVPRDRRWRPRRVGESSGQHMREKARTAVLRDATPWRREYAIALPRSVVEETYKAVKRAWDARTRRPKLDYDAEQRREGCWMLGWLGSRDTACRAATASRDTAAR
jgi:hypothetical protein